MQMKTEEYINNIFYADSRNMKEIPSNSVQLIVTSPPYFNVKDYSKDGYQKIKKADSADGQIGDINDYNIYINELLSVWKECYRVLKPNGKIAINTPLMPMLKDKLNTHYNRHIFDIDSDIKASILQNTKFYLLDVYIWNRINPSKGVMFGSYPYPRNFYAQNTCEFVSVYVKDGKPDNNITKEIKEKSKLTQEEWLLFTKQIWDIPIPNKKDLGFGKHSALMPEEIARRCIKLYTFIDDIVLDPFTGSGTTLRVAQNENRRYIGYEISTSYQNIINQKLQPPSVIPW